jgi:hypothetical protein
MKLNQISKQLVSNKCTMCKMKTKTWCKDIKKKKSTNGTHLIHNFSKTFIGSALFNTDCYFSMCMKSKKLRKVEIYQKAFLMALVFLLLIFANLLYSSGLVFVTEWGWALVWGFLGGLVAEIWFTLCSPWSYPSLCGWSTSFYLVKLLRVFLLLLLSPCL